MSTDRSQERKGIWSSLSIAHKLKKITTQQHHHNGAAQTRTKVSYSHTRIWWQSLLRVVVEATSRQWNGTGLVSSTRWVFQLFVLCLLPLQCSSSSAQKPKQQNFSSKAMQIDLRFCFLALRCFFFNFSMVMFLFTRLFSIQVSQPWNLVAQESGKTFDHRDGTEATATIGNNWSFQEQQDVQFCFAEEEENKNQEGIDSGESCQECQSVIVAKVDFLESLCFIDFCGRRGNRMFILSI